MTAELFQNGDCNRFRVAAERQPVVGQGLHYVTHVGKTNAGSWEASGTEISNIYLMVLSRLPS